MSAEKPTLNFLSNQKTRQLSSPRAHLHVVGMLRFVSDINQLSLPTPFTLFLGLFLSYGPFTCISFHKSSRQLSAFSLCSPSLISALLVLSTIYLFLKSLLKWFRRPGAFAVRCDPCRGRKASWRLRCALAAACWGQYISLARTSLRWVVGLARPNQSAGHAEP